MKLIRHITAILILAASTLTTAAFCPVASAQSVDGNGMPSLVEVYWQWSRTITAPALTNVIVLDEGIARAEVVSDGLKIFGLERGETVVLGYLHEKPVSIRVRVVPRPSVVLSPSMLRRQSEMAQGSFG
jgi:hypothetical protein